MPALLTRMSIRPNFAIVSATPFSTAASSTTFIATAKASDPFDLISFAVASAAPRSRSAITGIPPSAAKRTSISLPMPLAAPVTRATFRSKRDIADFLSIWGEVGRLFQVIEDDRAEAERQVGDVVAGRDHFVDRQPRDIAHRVLEELDRGRAGPGALHRDVLAMVAHEFADARRAVDVRDDLDHEVRPRQALQDRRRIELAVLVAHCRRHAEH